MQIGWGQRSKPSDPLVVFSGLGLVLLLAGRFYPFDRFPLVVCPLRTYAHVPCPSCGMTRAFVRFTHGEWADSLHVSPLGFAIAVVTTGFAIYALLRLTVMKRGIDVAFSPRESQLLRWGLPSLFLVNWIYLLLTGSAN